MLSAFKKTHRIFGLTASLLAYIVFIKEKPSSLKKAVNLKRTQTKHKHKKRKGRILKKNKLALYRIKPAGINNNIPTLKYEKLGQESSSQNERGSGSNPEKSNSQSKQLSYIDKSICHQENKDLSGNFEDYVRQGQNASDVLQLVIPEEANENSSFIFDIDIKAMLDEFKKPNPLASAFKLKEKIGDNKDVKNEKFSTNSLLEESKEKRSQDNDDFNLSLKKDPSYIRKPVRKHFKVKKRKKNKRSGRKGDKASQFNKSKDSSGLKL